LAEDESPPVEPEPAAAEPEQPGSEAPEEPAPGAAAPSLDDIASQIRAVPIGDFLLSMASTLLSMGYGKVGAGQLDEARGAIDAIKALLPVLEGRIDPSLKRDFEQALANLQIAYADASTKGPS
jgi:hypothetical protein